MMGYTRHGLEMQSEQWPGQQASVSVPVQPLSWESRAHERELEQDPINHSSSLQPRIQSGTKLDLNAYASLLRNAKSLSNVYQVHERIIENGKQKFRFLGSLIVQMYIRCGAVEDARAWFTRMYERNVFLWTFMIAEYAHAGQGQEALHLFDQMQHEGVVPDKFIFTSMLSACGSELALIQGKRIHARIMGSGYETEIAVGNALVNMYGRCGRLHDAQRTLDNMPERNVVSWTSMITSYVLHGQGKKAFLTFDQMHLQGVLPNKVTFLGIIYACTSEGILKEGKHIHEYIKQFKLDSDVVIACALITMYGKCASLEGARETFENMPERNVVSWNAMIAVFAQHGYSHEALQLFHQMQDQGLAPDKVTYINVLDAYGNQEVLGEGKRMHELIKQSGYELDVDVATALVNMYGRCSSLEDAWSIFDRMPERHMVSWNFMIGAYVRNGQIRDGIQLYNQMKQEGILPDKFILASMLSACASQAALEEGKRLHVIVRVTGFKSDTVVSTALVNMYGKCGSLECAKSVFDGMTKRDGVSWNAMIAGYAHYGQGKEALQFFDHMQKEGVIPDKVTFVSILSACATQVALSDGKQIHNFIICKGFESDIVVATALVNMYAKCGSLQDSWRIFNKMSKRNVVSWSAVIAAFAQHGHGKEALVLFDDMQQEGVKPNKVTFVSILSACSHAGLLDEGRHWWRSLKQDHGITPNEEHYSCMIDLLGRVGRLDEAEELIRKMSFEPTSVIWMTLIAACINKVDVERGERAAKRIFELDVKDASPYVMLSNLYLAAGRVNDADTVMNEMKMKGLKKPPGCSLIEVNGRVHEFFANDQRHPQKEEIYAELQRLIWQMKEAGYAPDTKLVLHGSEEEKELKLFTHSERLAVTFGIISTPPGTPLLITKNLRVCPDCHSAMKYISKLTDRQMVVRDANRFHHIKDGICSCADYW